MSQLTSLRLINFKAFKSFTVTFGSNGAFLVGPNNAGKSTVIAALRAAANMVRIGSRLKATDTRKTGGVLRHGHVFSAAQVDLVDENLQHEFTEEETRIVVTFGRDLVLEAVWPPDFESEGGFFFLRDSDVVLRQPAEVKRLFPRIGIVPVLSPIDHREQLLSPDYVRKNLDGRLASRHFRNQLRLLQDAPGPEGYNNELRAFQDFVRPWLPEMSLRELRIGMAAEGAELDLFVTEPGSRHEREVFWAGDGMQIWLQLLLHIYRLRDRDVVILDEPDVFLHADLQRRLVTLLEESTAQTIMATHSSEVLVQARQDEIVWVSRTRKRAVRAPGPALQAELSYALGTAFNLRIARALQARVALFVEGGDLKMMRSLARTVGANHLAKEIGIAVIPLEGVDRWDRIEPFKWMVKELLEQAITVYVVLDRDYRSDETVKAILERFEAAEIKGHIWSRHEIENYLLAPGVIARASGAPSSVAAVALDESAAALETEAFAGYHAEQVRILRPKGYAEQTISLQTKTHFDAIWVDPARRLTFAPGKEILRGLNSRLQAGGYKGVNVRALARELQTSEMDSEMRSLLLDVDRACSLPTPT